MVKNRILRRTGIALSMATIGYTLAVAPTFAANSKAATYEAVAGSAKTHAAAVVLVGKLGAKHLTGFVIEKDTMAGKTVYEVEHAYKTRAAAAAAMTKLTSAGFRNSVETDK